MNKKKRKLLICVMAVAILAADGAKSYVLARREVAHHPNLRCTRVLFVGVWSVSFTFDGAHPDSVATFTVAPLLPLVIRAQYCR